MIEYYSEVFFELSLKKFSSFLGLKAFKITWTCNIQIHIQPKTIQRLKKNKTKNEEEMQNLLFISSILVFFSYIERDILCNLKEADKNWVDNISCIIFSNRSASTKIMMMDLFRFHFCMPLINVSSMVHRFRTNLSQMTTKKLNMIVVLEFQLNLIWRVSARNKEKKPNETLMNQVDD